MVKSLFALLLLLNLSILNSASLDGSCFYLVNKGLSNSIRVDVKNPDNPLTTSTLSYTESEVVCAYLNTDKTSYTLNFLRYPFKNLKFNSNKLLVQVNTDYKNNQITQNFDNTPNDQRFIFTLDNGDYLISSLETNTYLTAQQGVNTITDNPLISNCLQRWTLINVDNYSWDGVCVYIQHKKSGKFIDFQNSVVGDLKLDDFDPKTTRICLKNGNRNSYNFINQIGNKELYIDISKSNQSDGAKVVKWRNNGGFKNQRFMFIPVNFENTNPQDFYIATFVGKNIESRNQVNLIQNSIYNDNQVFTVYLA